MRPITLVLPHYRNLGMLKEQQKVWMSYPEALRAHLHVVVVDDCSPRGSRPTRKSVIADGLGSFRIYRKLEKQRWNWLHCRNLGALVATTDWLLLTDMDHVLPVQTWARLMDGLLQEPVAYRFRRVDAPRRWPYALSECAPYKMHNDTWLLTRRMFFTPLKWDHGRYVRGVGGYDERLSGCYGTSGEFVERVLKTAAVHVVLSEPVIRYEREIIPDASTDPSVYTRKNDPENDAELKRRKADRDALYEWQPLHGLIPHEELYAAAPVEQVA